jgi:hypothetical protein
MSLKAWEAMKALQEGKCVRDADGDHYTMNEHGHVLFTNGAVANLRPRHEPYELVEEPLADEDIAAWCDECAADKCAGQVVSIAMRTVAAMIRTRKRQP